MSTAVNGSEFIKDYLLAPVSYNLEIISPFLRSTDKIANICTSPTV